MEYFHVALIIFAGYVDFNGTEWCILKLGVPGQVDHVIVDTCHFKGMTLLWDQFLELNHLQR